MSGMVVSGWASLVHAHRTSTRIALTTGRQVLHYAEWADRGERLARALLASGLRRPARVALLLPNGPEFAVALYACARIGLTAVPLSTWAAPGELRRTLEHADAQLVIASDVFPEALAGLVDAVRMPGSGAPPVFLIGAPAAGCAPIEALLDRADDSDPAAWGREQSAGSDDADLVVLYTSGSTGRPKGVILTQGAVRRNAGHIRRRMGIESPDRVYTYFPMFFSGGLCNALSGAAAAGAELVTLDKHDPSAAAELIRRRHCTARNVWHDGLGAIVSSPGFEADDLARMRRGLLLDPDVFERFGLPFDEGVNMYGSTETATAFTCHRWSDPADLRRTTHGTPLPGNEFRIVDADRGRPVSDGEVGEIAVRGPNLMRGYTDGSHEAMVDDGWFRTGDLGVRLGEQLRYTGRLKTLIKVKGLTVQPEEVEAVLLAHPAVDRAVVVGVGGDDASALWAVVSVHDDARAGVSDPELVDALSIHSRRELSSYKVPRIRIVPESAFPLSGSRKVDRQAAARMVAR